MRCKMCGMDVAVRPDGRCFIGHRVTTKSEQAPPATAQSPASLVAGSASPPAVREPTDAQGALSDLLAGLDAVDDRAASH